MSNVLIICGSQRLSKVCLHVDLDRESDLVEHVGGLQSNAGQRDRAFARRSAVSRAITAGDRLGANRGRIQQQNVRSLADEPAHEPKLGIVLVGQYE
jgi:hypothetical protein